jgi:hypothetical protein
MILSPKGKIIIFVSLFISVIVTLSCQPPDKIVTKLSNSYWYDLSRPFNSSIIINDGALMTDSKIVKVRFSARDNIGIIGYYLSDLSTQPKITSGGWIHITPATAVSVNKKYKLQQTESLKKDHITLFVWFKDAAGNVSKKSSADISYFL